MRAFRHIAVILLLALVSCAPDRFAQLDRLLEQTEAIDSAVKHRTDSLRAVYQNVPWGGQIIKWEAAEALYKEWRHLNLDSSVFYTNEMLRLAGDNPSRQLRSRAAQVRNLVRAEKLPEADSVFASIVLPQDASPEDCEAYFYSAERMINYLPLDKEELRRRLNSLSEDYLRRDSTSVKAHLLKVKAMRSSGSKEEALHYVFENLHPENIEDIYDLSSYYMAVSSLYLEIGRPEISIKYAAKAAYLDISCGMNDYFSLYQLAQMLFRTRDKQRASSYMNRAIQDALDYNFPMGVRRAARASAIMNGTIQQINRNNRIILVAGITIVSILLAISLFLLFFSQKSLGKVIRINGMYRESQDALKQVSLIKDRMLGEYMGLASAYIYKVDENKSKYRKILKDKGADALMAVFREPNFADMEYPHFWNNFDKIFLSIFPNFVESVNRLMQQGRGFICEGTQSLNTELRILALLRLGITESARIANILHISKGTVYTYRCVMRQNSMHPESFEQDIQTISDISL